MAPPPMAELDQANVKRLLAAVDNPDARNDTAAQLSKVAAKAEGSHPERPRCPRPWPREALRPLDVARRAGRPAWRRRWRPAWRRRR